MDLGLSDRVYIIVGASRGIGQACAHLLVAEGARVVLNSRDSSALSQVSRNLGGPERALAVPGDITHPPVTESLLAAAVARYGRLDGALITMGNPPESKLTAAPDDHLRWEFERHVLAPTRLMRTIATMPGHEGMSLVLLASNHGPRTPRVGWGTALRASVSSTVTGLAAELGTKNARLNTVFPGLAIGSPGIGSAHVTTGQDPSQRRPLHESGALSTDPQGLGRLADIWELARPCVFLLSPAASYITGQILTVDGGL